MKNNLKLVDIKHLSKLSGLKLTQEEIRKIAPQLQRVLNYFESMSELDTSEVDPSSQTNGYANVSKEDQVSSNSLPVEDALYNAQDTKNNLFKVPLVLKK